MSTHPQRDSLQKAWGLPELYDCPRDKWVELSTFKSWSSEKQRRARDSALVVVDGAVWAASDIPLASAGDRRVASIYSGNGEGIGLYTQQRSFAEYEMSAPRQDGEPQALSLVASTVLYDATNLKEDFAMNQNISDPGQLEDLLADLEQQEAAKAPALNQSESFNNAPSTDVTAPTTGAGLSDSVKAQLSGVQRAKADLLYVFNGQHAKMMGYIVGEEARIEPVLRAVPLEQGGKKVLEESAPPDVREKFNTTNSAPIAYLQKQYEWGWRQTTPGRIEAAIIDMPLGGMVDYLQFQQPGDIKFDSSNTTMKKVVIPYKALFTFLNNYLRTGLKEAVETHGQFASIVKPDFTAKNKTENGVTKTVYRRKVVVEGRKTLVIPGNHLPIRVYEKVRYTDRLGAEELARLNVSTFYNATSATMGQRGRKIDFMSPEHAGLVNVNVVDGQPVVESAFLTQDQAKRKPIVVKPYWGDKTQTVDEIYLPVKELKEVGKEKVLKTRAIKYSAVDKNVLENPAERQKTSLESGEYADFINAVGADILNVDTLRGLTKSSRGGKKIGIDTVAKLEASMAEGNWSDPTVELDQSPEELTQIRNMLFTISTGVK